MFKTVIVQALNQTHVEIKKYIMENLIKDFYCGLCSLQFGNKIVFDMHQSIMHGIITKEKQEPVIAENKTKAEKKIIQCSICEANGASGRNLQIYIDSIHKGNKQYKCNTCDSSFFHKSNLKKHVSTVHEGNRQFICEICNVSFTQKETLKGHIESVHKGKKPLKCEICSISFTQRS